MTYTMGSLFAGIGGFDLGFERAGFKTSWQVEIDPYCQKVLAKNFPEAERFGDIRECGRHNLRPVDVICGGFPCQDISNAGKRAGIEGERSGLWSEMHRIIRELRPRVALIENVAALVNFGLERVLCDLAAIGFDAEWRIVSAADVGAPHLRRRLWIVAYPESEQGGRLQQPRIFANTGPGCELAYSEGQRNGPGSVFSGNEAKRSCTAYRHSHEWPARWGDNQFEHEKPRFEPRMGGTTHGVRARVDRLRGLGNAVVPQIPEMIARRIKQALDTEKAAA